MLGERLVAEAVEAMCTMVSVRSPEPVWKRFISNHGHVFFVLGIARHFWYLFDKRREGFVKMCNDKNVQRRVRGGVYEQDRTHRPAGARADFGELYGPPTRLRSCMMYVVQSRRLRPVLVVTARLN